MKHLKEYEYIVTLKTLSETINKSLNRILPDKYTIRFYNNTSNIKDINIKKHNAGYIYSSVRPNFILNLCSHTLNGSDFNLVCEFIIYKIKSNNVIIDVKREINDTWNYNDNYTVLISIKYFKDIINIFNQLTSEDLEIFINSKKYNI